MLDVMKITILSNNNHPFQSKKIKYKRGSSFKAGEIEERVGLRSECNILIILFIRD